MKLSKHLGADITEKVLYVFPDELVLHDGLPVVLQDLLELVDVVILVRRDEIRHRQDLRVALVGLRLLKDIENHYNGPLLLTFTVALFEHS